MTLNSLILKIRQIITDCVSRKYSGNLRVDIEFNFGGIRKVSVNQGWEIGKEKEEIQ